jgi:hypothetical protein
MTRIETWVYVVEHGTWPSGEPRRLWLKQDGLGRWLVTRHFQSSPTFYLTVDGAWTDRATQDTRHDERTATSLAIGMLLRAESETR